MPSPSLRSDRFNPFSDENIREHGHPRPATYVPRLVGELKVGDNVRLPDGTLFARIREITRPAPHQVMVSVGWTSWTTGEGDLCLVEG